MEYDYKKLNKKRKPREVKTLPKKGTWVPLSIAAYLKKYYNTQMIRWAYLNGKIEFIKFPVGPLLVNLDDIPSESLTCYKNKK